MRQPRFALAPLTLAALLAASLAVPAYAQPKASAPVAITIAGQPLGPALNELARQAGLQLLFPPALVAGKTAPGVSGRLTPQQAVERLLAGSGLIAVREGDAIVIKASPTPGDSVTLAEVVVAASVEREGTTEGTGSYTTRSMSTATRLPLSIRETPQAVNVVTRQQLDDRGVVILEDALASAPGISLTKDGPNRVAFYARGFVVESLMTDGLPSELSHYLSREMNSTPDMAIYDRVEVVRGATGLITGTGSPSAAINLVRKRPTRTPQVSLAVSAGSWNNHRTEVDASGPLNEAGTLRGRAVVAYQKKDSFQKVAGGERSVLYATAEADLTSRTLLTAGISYQSVNNTDSWGGLPTAMDGSSLGLPRSSYLGNKWDYWDQDNTTFFSRLEHRLDNDWKLLFSAIRTLSKLDMLGSQLERIDGENGSQWGQYVGQYAYRDQQNSYDAYASGPFQWLGRRHEFVAGASLRDLHFKGNGNARDEEIDMDIHHWDAGSLAPRDMDLQYWRQNRTTRQKGVYATARFNVTDTFKFIAGSRLDWFDHNALTANGNRSTPASYSVDRRMTRYAGITYDLGARHSLYASYTDIFKPQSELNASGMPLKPIVGKNYEVGIKGEYLDGSLNASATLFRIDQQNRAKALSRNQCSELVSDCYEAAGEVRSQGLELETNGRIAPGWQLSAGYTYAQARYRKDADASKVGTPFGTDLPRHMFKLFTHYQLPGELHRWSVGGGLTWQSRIYNEGTGYRIEQKAYALTNFMLNYQASERLELRLNIDNLFDKHYWRAIAANADYAVNQYGEPRKFTLTARYRF